MNSLFAQGGEFAHQKIARGGWSGFELTDALLAYAESENLDGILFAADIEKAFDSVEHNFIFTSLKKLGFGEDFIRLVKTCLNDSPSCVINNGTSTRYFKVERGTRHGDPLSPYLLIITLETLLIQLSAYADDTTFSVKDSHSLHRVL